MDSQAKQQFIDSFAPVGREDSKWDAIFLCQGISLEEYWSWLFAVLINPNGELHQEWLAHQNRLKVQARDEQWDRHLNPVAGH